MSGRNWHHGHQRRSALHGHLEHQKNKVVFIMGATGMGKSHLSIDLATHFSTEIINFDKRQVYKGLDIVTNKITDSEKEGVPHYLLEKKCILLFRYCGVGYVSIVVGGSNSYIDKLVEDPMFAFKSNYDSCFIWIDIDVSTLDPFLLKRIDYMVQTVDEVREIFSPEEENKFDTCEESTKKILLESAIEEIKVSTCNLVCRQLEKIRRFMNEKMWPLYHIDAINVFKENKKEGADDKWKHNVLKPTLIS
ncbi:adenylate isopentenyltransferase 5, chloroplastic-like [Capsicum annuum]|uniref:adenylate isopentenyltransferase 5, chloroplastic-like n=1 Tax=Capsicum annuum TaxID=4072 RepID=UPI001FB0C857|nr:adenylate isopentenyltransferase 5, chloroplastic-like [Capsicum annuum]